MPPAAVKPSKSLSKNFQEAPFACSTSSQNGVETWRSGGHVISTTDSALAWSRLALRRGSEETMVLLFFYRTRGKKTKRKKVLASVSFVCFSLFFRLYSPLFLSLSLPRRARQQKRRKKKHFSSSFSFSVIAHHLILENEPPSPPKFRFFF